MLCVACGALAARPAPAGVVANVYKVAVPVTDRSEPSRMAGFQAAMRVVLVRVTGNRAAATDPTFAPLVSAADRYVQEYRYAPDGRLWVGFDGASVERWLTRAGAPVWGRTRPLTYVLLTVPGGASGAIVTGDAASDLKAAIDAQADARGIALVWPSAQDLAAEGLDYALVLRADPHALAPLAKRHGADGLLIGHASDAGAGASVQWLFQFQTQTARAAGAVEGVNLAADSYAATFAVSGAYAPVEVVVAGIQSVADYARVQHLFESLTPVSEAAVTELDGDRIRFRLDVRGGAAPLARTLALNGLLAADPAGAPGTPGAAGELRFHLRR